MGYLQPRLQQDPLLDKTGTSRGKFSTWIFQICFQPKYTDFQICSFRCQSDLIWAKSDIPGPNRPVLRQNVLNSDLKKSRICPIWGQFGPLWSQTYHPCNHESVGQIIPMWRTILGTRSTLTEQHKASVWLSFCYWRFHYSILLESLKNWTLYSTRVTILSHYSTLLE